MLNSYVQSTSSSPYSSCYSSFLPLAPPPLHPFAPPPPTTAAAADTTTTNTNTTTTTTTTNAAAATTTTTTAAAASGKVIKARVEVVVL